MKADESSPMPAPKITSDSESECNTQQPLPPLTKMIGADPTSTLNSLISFADLTSNMADLTLDISILKKTRATSVKVSPGYVIKRKTKNKSLVVSESYTDKKADSSHEESSSTSNEEIFKGVRAAFVNGLKHNLININQLCDANYKVLFTKTQGTIFNENEVVLISPRRRDVYVIDMSSFN
ncbi:hypothetical protein Tco_1258920 [Tanacetum coccineum]